MLSGGSTENQMRKLTAALVLLQPVLVAVIATGDD